MTAHSCSVLQGTFTSVTGTFKVPTPKAPEGSASVWVGIDGNTCAQAIFQAGIYVNFLPNGVHSYQGQLFDISTLACNPHIY